MRQANVHIEDVSRAARQGLLLATAAMALTTLALLASGIGPALALLAGAMVLAVGAVSGGFGLVARIALPARGPRRRQDVPAPRPVTALRVPQTR